MTFKARRIELHRASLARKRRGLIILDLDDTLIDTSDVYWRARTRFVETMVPLGLPPEKVVELFENLDAKNIEKLGFMPTRYGKSMIQTYRELLRQTGRDPERRRMAAVERCGGMILKEFPRIIDGARQLLKWAKPRYVLALLTRGDRKLQLSKLRRVRLFEYFSFIKVVARKETAAFREIMEIFGSEPKSTWIIGDSIRTDINPALRLGAECILYEYRHEKYQWRQEYGFPPIGDFYKVRDLREAIEILKTPKPSRKVRHV